MNPRTATLIAWGALAGLACSPPPPRVAVIIAQGTGAPAVPGLARLTMVVQACGADAPLLEQTLPVRGDDPPAQELDLAPGTEVYVHLQGWLECNPPCTSEPNPGVDACVCVDDPDAPAQILRAEGCTDWFTAEDRQVTVTLGEPRGLCPPLPKTCPAAPE